MVGQNASEPFGLHASETNGFLRFTMKLLKDHERFVEPVLYKCLHEGGQALVTLLNLNENMRGQVQPADAEDPTHLTPHLSTQHSRRTPPLSTQHHRHELPTFSTNYELRITPTHEAYVNAVKIHIANLEGMGIGFKPKHHMLMEHAAKLLKHGAPHLSGTWVDETRNGDLKPIAATSHRMVWHRRILRTFRTSFGLAKRRRLGERK